MALKVVRIINQPVTSNCFLLYDREVNNDCLVVDPGSEYPDELEQLLKDLNLYPKYILLTHEHFDHIWGCNYLVEKYHSKIICSVTGDTLLKDLRTVTKLFCGSKEKLVVTINRIKRLQGKGFYVYPGHGDGFDLDNYDLNKAL